MSVGVRAHRPPWYEVGMGQGLSEGGETEDMLLF